MMDSRSPTNSRKPGATLAKLLRAPARVYDWHAGWILGRRFLRLTHIGRRSGRQYHTMLEVIGENQTAREVIVIAGLGPSAQWYRNLLAHDAIEVAIGSQRYTPTHRQLSESEAALVLAEYERRNRLVTPVIRRVLSWLVGWRYDSSETARRRLVRELPMIGLRPADNPTNTTASQMNHAQLTGRALILHTLLASVRIKTSLAAVSVREDRRRSCDGGGSGARADPGRVHRDDRDPRASRGRPARLTSWPTTAVRATCTSRSAAS